MADSDDRVAQIGRGPSRGGGASHAPPGIDRDGLRRAAMVALLVFALVYGALALTRFNDRIASLWLANALVVGLVLKAPRREWSVLLAAAFCANFAANLLNHDPLRRAGTLALVNSVESIIVIGVMAGMVGARTRFDDGRMIARFLLSAGLIGPLCAALMAAATLAPTNRVDFFAATLNWYLADALGLLTLGTLLLAAHAKDPAAPRATGDAGAVGIFLTSAATAIAFTRESGPLLFVVAPVLLIATLRAPFTATMVALVASAAIAVVATAVGIGPIARAVVDSATQIHLLQGFIASLLFVILPVRALIGERERLGGVIAQSERLRARAARASPAGTIHFNARGQATYANPSWSGLTGLDRTALDDDRWLDAIDPADRSAAKSLWSRARATLQPCRAEYRFVAQDGSSRFADLQVDPEVEDGCVLGFVARLTDVTDQRRSRDAVQEREAHDRLVTEHAHDVILRLGLDGRPLYVSGASLRVTGYAPDELVGRSLADRIHPDDLAEFVQMLARLSEVSADAAVEFRLRHRDGRYRWFELTQRPLFDGYGAPSELIASLRDIDLRRRSELMAAEVAAKMRESNRLLLLAEELAGVGHWHFDPAHGEFDYSLQINRLLQRDRADQLRVADIVAIVHRDDRRTLLACLSRARRLAVGAECRLRVHAASGVRYLRVVAQIDPERGAAAGWVGVVQDVTDKVASSAAPIDPRIVTLGPPRVSPIAAGRAARRWRIARASA